MVTMETIDIKCPKCGKILRLQKVQGIETKIIPCPVCGQKTPFAACERVVKKEPCSDTVLHTEAKAESVFIVQRDNQRSYELKPGFNSIGRAADSSTADVKIATADRGISRVHSVIQVAKTPLGNTRCIISNAKNKNATYINGVHLEDGDAFVVKDGDKITMSRSEFYLEFR